MFRSVEANDGFTMIELLMVIVLVAILGSVALPQFLDFRKEGKIAAAQELEHSINSGLKLQLAQARLRCNGSGTYPPVDSLSANDITAGSSPLCTTAQIPNAAERRIVDSDGMPTNPYNGLTTVSDCSSDPYVGWCYAQAFGMVIASTATVPGGSPGALTAHCAYDSGANQTFLSGTCDSSEGNVSTSAGSAPCSGGAYSITAPGNYSGYVGQSAQGSSTISFICS